MELLRQLLLPYEVTHMIHTIEKMIKHNAGLLNLAQELGNASNVCQVVYRKNKL